MLRWWIKCLECERLDVPDIEFNVGSDSKDWPDVVLKQDLYESYEKWCLERKMQPEQITIFYTKTPKFGIEDSRKTIRGDKKRVYKIPSVELCKELLKLNLGVSI